jgi:hypothetical protein
VCHVPEALNYDPKPEAFNETLPEDAGSFWFDIFLGGELPNPKYRSICNLLATGVAATFLFIGCDQSRPPPEEIPSSSVMIAG